MLYLLVFLILVIAGMYLMQSKLGISKEDTDVMWFGVIAFAGIENLSKLIVVLATGGSGALTYLIMVLLYGAFGYYLFNRSGL